MHASDELKRKNELQMLALEDDKIIDKDELKNLFQLFEVKDEVD